ncbi:Protein-tyrosine-phosphatase MKP1 [Capsicum annuum]|nr:Protein-tyrosine-phosphatase MKP1 [Capsicum annuum]
MELYELNLTCDFLQGLTLNLDLSNIHKNPEINAGLVRREKIAFFDKVRSKVAEHVFLGGDAVAKDKDIPNQNGITHVLNCVDFVCPKYFKCDFIYWTLWLQDSPSEDITSILYDVFDYFEEVREQHGRVFVHCYQGVSRSTSLVIGYIMWREGQSFDDAFECVKSARGIADPNIGFACQLLQCQKKVHAFPLSPSSLLRMYRVAPHSPYDLLHLIPKMLNDPSPSTLDSKGAFIIHIPSSIYVWIGRKSEAVTTRTRAWP